MCVPIAVFTKLRLYSSRTPKVVSWEGRDLPVLAVVRLFGCPRCEGDDSLGGVLTTPFSHEQIGRKFTLWVRKVF
jgi:hypothetical protein